MGVYNLCRDTEFGDSKNAFESVVIKSIRFGNDDKAKTPLRTVSFGSQDLEPMILKSSGLRKMIVERSVSLKAGELERLISSVTLQKKTDASLLSTSVDAQEMDNQSTARPTLDLGSPKHQAAIKLQKVYKSFRTRRKLADCAVLVEQSWWKLLDFVELKHSSISFFDMEKHESAISRWSRARTRAAKVGKGLSKNDKAQKLALQHWLEAIDPRHRYGHNLHFYYVQWLHSKSREPFFYWLDIGEGKEVNLVEKCPRAELQQQCIKYLGPMERKAFEVVVNEGRFVYQQSGELLHTTEDVKWIFVLSTSKTMYVGKKKKGTFQHSSFLAGGVTIAAGRVIVESGILKAVWPHSGHYQPTEENFSDFLSFLRDSNVDLTNVKTSPLDEDGVSSYSVNGTKHVRNNSSEGNLIQMIDQSLAENPALKDSTLSSISVDEHASIIAGTTNQKSERLHNLGRMLISLEIPKRDEFLESVESNPIVGLSSKDDPLDPSADDDLKSAEGDGECNEVSDPITEETIVQRINAKKRTESYQLGKQLSCRWTTGAGPRIGCVRDYPSQLQFMALEQVNLSPRSVDRSRRNGTLSRRSSTPGGFYAEAAVSIG